MKNRIHILAILLSGIVASGYGLWGEGPGTKRPATSGSAPAARLAGDGADESGIRGRSMPKRPTDSSGYRRESLDPEAIAAMDPAARLRLMEKIGGLRDPDEREKAWAALLGTIATLDPAEAIELAGRLPAGKHGKLARWVGLPLMKSDPSKAAAFMIEMADPDDLGTTYTEIASTWVDQDAKAAGDWLNTLPKGPDLDRASRAYAIKAAGQDPAGALEWAASIGNESLRAESLLVVYQTWRKEDLAAAEAALKGLGVSMEQLNVDLRKSRPKLTHGDDDD